MAKSLVKSFAYILTEMRMAKLKVEYRGNLIRFSSPSGFLFLIPWVMQARCRIFPNLLV